jgi:EpsI family protein
MMTGSRLKAIIFFVMMAAAFGVATAWKPTTHLADQRAKIDLETLFPRSFGDWVVDDRMPVQLVSPDQAAVLNAIYNQTLSRTYVNRKGDRIMLSVAYGGDQSDATRAHRPEVCYPAQGFQMVSQDTAALQLSGHDLPVRRVVAKLGGRTEPITYWIMVGETPSTSGTNQKLAQLRYSVRGVIPDGMLVRVSSIDLDKQRAFAIQEKFVSQLIDAIPAEARPRVVGTSTAKAAT